MNSYVKLVQIITSILIMFLLLVSVGIKGMFIDHSYTFPFNRYKDPSFIEAHRSLIGLDCVLLFLVVPVSILLSCKKISSQTVAQVFLYSNSAVFMVIVYVRSILSAMAVCSDTLAQDELRKYHVNDHHYSEQIQKYLTYYINAYEYEIFCMIFLNWILLVNVVFSYRQNKIIQLEHSQHNTRL